jgi:DNA-binding transcriptional LysR family regulator
MELRDIEYFAVVAEHGHLGRAAEALGLSTPALSKSLRRLEKAMQAKLVSRTPKGVELTAEGNALLSHMRPLRLSLRDMAREVSELSQGRSGHLRLGSIPGPADHLVPTACSALLNEAPKVSVTVTVATNPVLVPALRNGGLDLILMDTSKPPYENITQEHLFDEKLVVYCSANHRLATRERVAIADLAEERWASSGPDSLPWKWVHRVFEDHGLAPPRVALITSQMQVRLQAIATSDLIGFGPKRSLRQVAPRLRLTEIPVKELTWTRHVGIGYRKDAYLSPVARRFVEILKTTARETTADKQNM